MNIQGFLPEGIDNFIIDYIYPSYSIQVGVVFACSTAYGVWKVGCLCSQCASCVRSLLHLRVVAAHPRYND